MKPSYSQSYVNTLHHKINRLHFIVYTLSLKVKRTIDYTNAHIEAIEKDANEQLQARIEEVRMLVEALEGNSKVMYEQLVKCEDALKDEQKEVKRLKEKLRRFTGG